MQIVKKESDIIRLCNMAFFGYHGPRSIERQLGQHYQVDVEIEIDIREAGETDDIQKTIDYTQVYEITREIITKHSYKLIESVAEKIAENILKEYQVVRTDVSVRKLKPAIQGIMDYVEISISRKAIYD